MVNAHAQILYGRSKEQFDRLASSFKQESEKRSSAVQIVASPKPPAIPPARKEAGHGDTGKKPRRND